MCVWAASDTVSVTFLLKNLSYAKFIERGQRPSTTNPEIQADPPAVRERVTGPSSAFLSVFIWFVCCWHIWKVLLYSASCKSGFWSSFRKRCRQLWKILLSTSLSLWTPNTQSSSFSIYPSLEIPDMVGAHLHWMLTWSISSVHTTEKYWLAHALLRPSAVLHPGPPGICRQELWWVSSEAFGCGKHPELEADAVPDCGGAVQAGAGHPPGLHVCLFLTIWVSVSCFNFHTFNTFNAPGVSVMSSE